MNYYLIRTLKQHQDKTRLIPFGAIQSFQNSGLQHWLNSKQQHTLNRKLIAQI